MRVLQVPVGWGNSEVRFRRVPRGSKKSAVRWYKGDPAKWISAFILVSLFNLPKRVPTPKKGQPHGSHVRLFTDPESKSTSPPQSSASR